MSYSKDVYDEVQQKLYSMKLKSSEKLEQRKKLFFQRFPEAAEIEKELALTSIKAAKAVLKGANTKSELISMRERNTKLRERLACILKSVNLPPDYLEAEYNCKKCSDEGYVDGIMCDCMKDMLKKSSYEKLSSISPLVLSSLDCRSLV